ncbi:hypothetical protein PCNPT3_09465 [Psychromonas sp. CNPT3]|uniref:YgaP family membrane protein n=1 Tax=Psychromonas sp. CNPT3 TaxID=314282 RepID=UPI00006E4842|nr:DUF2892 domain-containing protein [Psychromonas sp. CNPT3]AGH81831.1 hypothetical protein PCNPT3_09465 [Psychromonas sp. CNPT3]
MKKNVGCIDRAVRITAGILIILCGIYYQSLWGALGFIPILTGSLGWCPAYLPFGISTCKRPEE